MSEQSLLAESAILHLMERARQGDRGAAIELRDLGLLIAQSLEQMVFVETQRNPRGGVCRQIARESLDWPFRLSAIDSVRSGPSTGNPEKFSKFLILGSETGIIAEAPKARGRKRNFQGKSGFALKVYRLLKQDLRRYRLLDDLALSEIHYYTWSYSTVLRGGEVTPAPKSQNLHRLFMHYVAALRIAEAGDIDAWVEVATLWAHVTTENQIQREGVWPDVIYKEAAKYGEGGVESQLRSYIKEGFITVVKEFGA